MSEARAVDGVKNVVLSLAARTRSTSESWQLVQRRGQITSGVLDATGPATPVATRPQCLNDVNKTPITE